MNEIVKLPINNNKIKQEPFVFTPDEFMFLRSLADLHVNRRHEYFLGQESRESPDRAGYFRFIHLPFTAEQLEALQRQANVMIVEDRARELREKADAIKDAWPWWRKFGAHVWKGINWFSTLLVRSFILVALGVWGWGVILGIWGALVESKGFFWGLIMWWETLA